MDEEMRVTLTLENDEELECLVLTILELEDQKYIALLPLEADEDYPEGDVFLYRYLETEGEDPDLDNIEDDEEYERVADLFEEWLDTQEYEDMEPLTVEE